MCSAQHPSLPSRPYESRSLPKRNPDELDVSRKQKNPQPKNLHHCRHIISPIPHTPVSQQHFFFKIILSKQNSRKGYTQIISCPPCISRVAFSLKQMFNSLIQAFNRYTTNRPTAQLSFHLRSGLGKVQVRESTARFLQQCSALMEKLTYLLDTSCFG